MKTRALSLINVKNRTNFEKYRNVVRKLLHAKTYIPKNGFSFQHCLLKHGIFSHTESKDFLTSAHNSKIYIDNLFRFRGH